MLFCVFCIVVQFVLPGFFKEAKLLSQIGKNQSVLPTNYRMFTNDVSDYVTSLVRKYKPHKIKLPPLYMNAKKCCYL
jgi:hypothetical protein